MLFVVLRRPLSCQMIPKVVLSLWKRGRCAQSVWQLATRRTVRGLIPHLGQETFSCVISGFHRDVDETCALLGSYTTSRGTYLLTFRSTYQTHFQESRVMTTTRSAIAQTSAFFRFFRPEPIQTDIWGHPASCKMDTSSLELISSSTE